MNDNQLINKSPLFRRMLAYGIVATIVIPLLLVACLLIVLALIATIVAATNSIGNFWGVIFGVLIFVAGYPIALTAHECGHAAAARLVGWQISSIRVGPFILVLHSDCWRLVWRRRTNWFVGAVNINLHVPVRWKTAVLYAAGPVANFVGGIFFGLLFAISNSYFVSYVFCSIATHCVFLGAANFLPVRERGIDTDGLVLFKLITLPNWNEVSNNNCLR